MGVAGIHQRTFFSSYRKESGLTFPFSHIFPVRSSCFSTDAAERRSCEGLDLGIWLVLFRGGRRRRLLIASESSARYGVWERGWTRQRMLKSNRGKCLMRTYGSMKSGYKKPVKDVRRNRWRYRMKKRKRKRVHTNFLVTLKKVCDLSGMPSACLSVVAAYTSGDHCVGMSGR